VYLYDITEAQLRKSEESIRWSVEKLHSKNPEEWPSVEAVLDRIRFVTDLELAGSCAMIVEAVVEKFEIKTELFRKLDKICNPSTLFFSNTSAIPISRLASATDRPGKFCGLHFFSPVPLMKLVEVIRGEQTVDSTVAYALEKVRSWRKTPVIVKKDRPGFIVNRLLIGMALEAMRMVEEGIADPQEIDTAMKLGCGYKMGPLETADMSGLDIFMHAAEAIYQESGDEKFDPPQILKQLVSAGHLGRKTGKGIVT
jgi:3-hydroxybutyryl-CoA dehydrogenase